MRELLIVGIGQRSALTEDNVGRGAGVDLKNRENLVGELEVVIDQAAHGISGPLTHAGFPGTAVVDGLRAGEG